MIILGIETSCDETSAALIKAEGFSFEILSQVVVSQIDIHQRTHGVVPEVAAREHALTINPVIAKAFEDAKIGFNDIDLIAVTYGPGLVGSLMIGLEAAKCLSYVYNKPLVGVNHLKAHIQSNFFNVESGLIQDMEYPAIGLLVSGGHTELILINSKTDFQIVGQTHDDAVGESFDKVATLMKLPYPGGPVLAQKAVDGNRSAYKFPVAMKSKDTLDFSYSGLKTAVRTEVFKHEKLSEKEICDIAASFESAAIEQLINKTRLALKKYSAKAICIAGGVSANKFLRSRLETEFGKEYKVLVPPFYLCTDNATMIAMGGYLETFGKDISELKATWKTIAPNPSLNI